MVDFAVIVHGINVWETREIPLIWYQTQVRMLHNESVI
jgi:hypothetical protein